MIHRPALESGHDGGYAGGLLDALDVMERGSALPQFVPGLALARSFYQDIVRDLVAVPHAAGLLGEGSEVLSFDQLRSTDHAWGPRLLLLVDDQHVPAVAAAIDAGLPQNFKGWPVRFLSWQSNSVRHHVEVTTLGAWARGQLDLDVEALQFPVPFWLAVPQQRLLQVTGGEVFHDDSGALQGLRAALAWYPRDVWLWAMASQWHLIGNAEPRIGRCAEAGDTRGSVLVAARIARLIVELCFLQERQYRPYDKWIGSAFSRLSAASVVAPQVDAILHAAGHAARTGAVNSALAMMAQRHNEMGLTEAVVPAIDDFQVGINGAVRPYRVVNAGHFVEACKNAIADPALRALVTVGTFDQITHGDDALVNFTDWPRHFASIYQRELDGLSSDAT